MPGLLLGSAPTAVQVKNFHFNGFRIGIGDMPWRAPELGPFEFWLASNGYYPLPQKVLHSWQIRRRSKYFVFSGAFLQRTKNPNRVINKLRSSSKCSSFVTFDERHFENELCENLSNCCAFALEFNNFPTIQEQLSKVSGYKTDNYPDSHTAATYGLALTILLGLNPIFISGIELPRKLENYTWYKAWKSPTPIHSLRNYLLRLRNPQKANDIGEGFTTTMEAFQIIVNCAVKLGVKIYCLSESSELLKVSGISYMSLENANNLMKK